MDHFEESFSVSLPSDDLSKVALETKGDGFSSFQLSDRWVDPEPTSPVKPILFTMRFDEGVFVAEDADPDLRHYFGTGPSEKDAVESLVRSLQDTWEGLRNHPDHELTKDALILRERLASYFDSVCDVKN